MSKQKLSGGWILNFQYVHSFVRLLFVMISIVIIFFAFFYFSSFTYPFIIAWVIAFFMNPIVSFLHIKGKLPRSLAVLIVLIFIFSLIASILVLLVTEIITLTEYLAKSSPDFIDTVVKSIENWINLSFIPFVNELSAMFFGLGQAQQDAIITNIQEIGTTLAQSVASILQTIITKLPAFISWFPNAAMVLIFTILSTFFISKEWYRYKHIAGRFVPHRIKENSMNVYRDLRKALFGFLKAQLTLITITFVIVLIGLLILRVKYAFVLSIVIGIIDLLPYLGTGFVFVPWIIYTFITENYSLGIGLIVLYVVIIVQRQLMEPKIVSTNIGVNPLATLVAIFVGLKVFGFAGMIIGPIILVFIFTLYRTGILMEIWNFIRGAKTV